jgi:hypothetical protein
MLRVQLRPHIGQSSARLAGGPQVHGPDGGVDGRMAGHQDHGQAQPALLEDAEKIDAAHSRHLVIHQDDLETAAGQQRRRLLGPFEVLHRMPLFLQRLLQEPAQVGVIVNDQNGGQGQLRTETWGNGPQPSFEQRRGTP